MKKASFFLGGIFFLLLSVNANAQSKTGADYFVGKWKVLVKGTPNGDVKMNFVLQRQDSTLTGTVQDSTGKEISKIDRAELTGDTATVYFSTQGYDVSLAMKKKDEDHITGSLMDMFAAEGDRIKATK